MEADEGRSNSVTRGVQEHVQRVAEGMINRHHGVSGALRACQQNIDSPTTEAAGKKFWGMVKEILQREAAKDGIVGSTAHAV